MGLLQDAKLDRLYEQDIAGLNPLLDAMSQRGMPVDGERRLAVAQALQQERAAVLVEMQTLVPDEARRMKVCKRCPTQHGPLCSVGQYAGDQIMPCDCWLTTPRESSSTVNIWVCCACGQQRVTKTHPCLKRGEVRMRVAVPAMVWAYPLSFTPSNDQMKRYCKVKGYKLPVKDGRETADETALRRLALKHETDALFPLILKYRELDKLVGTYVGRNE